MSKIICSSISCCNCHKEHGHEIKVNTRYSIIMIIILIAVTHSFSADICMEFGIEKCATLKMEKRKKREGIGVTLPTGEVLKDLAEECYRYLGILESDVIHHIEMKKLVAAEYYRRVKKVVRPPRQAHLPGN